MILKFIFLYGIDSGIIDNDTDIDITKRLFFINCTGSIQVYSDDFLLIFEIA